MRIFETLLLVSTFLYILNTLSLRNRRIIFTFIVSSSIIHIIFEGFRWQLFLFYIVLVYISFDFFTYGSIKQSKLIRYLNISLICISLILALIFPVFNLPKPTGEFNVGVTKRTLVNNKRDLFFNNSSDKRLNISIWYPIDPIKGDKEVPYSNKSKIYSKWLAKSLELPSFIFSHTNLIKTNSFLDKNISNKQLPYPVVIFSHAMFSVLNQNTILFEQLASNGYIVISISHTYESSVTIFSDDDYIPYSERLMELYYKELKTLYPIMAKRFNEENIETKNELAKEFIESSIIPAKMIDIRVQDINFIINKLVELNNNDPILHDSISIDDIGVMGHSLGGAAAFKTLLVNPSIKAGINIDGNQYGSNLSNPLNKPFAFLTTENFQDINDVFYQKRNYSKVIFEGTEHLDFTDTPYFSKLFILLQLTSNRDITFKMNSYITSFFDIHLKKL